MPTNLFLFLWRLFLLWLYLMMQILLMMNDRRFPDHFSWKSIIQRIVHQEQKSHYQHYDDCLQLQAQRMRLFMPMMVIVPMRVMSMRIVMLFRFLMRRMSPALRFIHRNMCIMRRRRMIPLRRILSPMTLYNLNLIYVFFLHLFGIERLKQVNLHILLHQIHLFIFLFLRERQPRHHLTHRLLLFLCLWFPNRVIQVNLYLHLTPRRLLLLHTRLANPLHPRPNLDHRRPLDRPRKGLLRLRRQPLPL